MYFYDKKELLGVDPLFKFRCAWKIVIWCEVYVFQNNSVENESQGDFGYQNGKDKILSVSKIVYSVIVIDTCSVYKLSDHKFEKRSVISKYNRDFGRLGEKIYFVLTKKQK